MVLNMTMSRELNEESLYKLLNLAFDGWGDVSYFKFKYNKFPYYNVDQHNFFVERDGNVIASRRIYLKHLVNDKGEIQPIHVHGGAAVHPNERRQGLFTELVNRSKKYSQNSESPVIMTFNRRGKISTQAHMRRDWQNRTLPLHILPLNLEPLITKHASEVLPDFPGLDFATTTVGTKISKLLPEWMTSRAIEIATTGECSRPIAKYAQKSDFDSNATIHYYDKNHLNAVNKLFSDELAQFDLAFERDQRHIEHMVGYEHSESAVAISDGTVVGFVCVGLIDKHHQVEGRIFDLISKNENIAHQLLNWAVTSARRRDADVVSILRENQLGPEWASLQTDLVMWDYIQERNEWHHVLENRNWRITAYDIL